MIYNLNDDGITHINIYSQGKTELGRLLSNWAHTPFTISDGSFESVEGYWYWLGTNDEHLKTLYGFNAKEYGRSLKRTINYQDEIFKSKIKNAILAKIKQNNLKDTIEKSTLPFIHYYVFGNIVRDASYKVIWIIEYFEELRAMFKRQSGTGSDTET